MYEPAIFSTEQVAYGDFYAWFKAKLVAAGWENITSNYATDGDVWHSTGESGTKNYYFSSFVPNTSAGMVVKPYLKYTPGNPGSPGVFLGNPNVSGHNVTYDGLALPITGTSTLPPDSASLTVSYSINKQRIIIAFTLAEGFFTQTNGSSAGMYGKSTLWHIGAPELYSTSDNDLDSAKGLIIYGTKVYAAGGSNNYFNNYAQIYRSYTSDTNIGPYNENTYYTLDANTLFRPRPISTGAFTLLDIIAGGPNEGTFLKLNDIFMVPEVTLGSSQGLYDGDLLTDGEYTYKVVLVQIPGFRVHPFSGATNIYAIRVE